ncbi:DNA-directed RNA polymerase II subunit RPB4 [Candida viswanathii]|uniref:DNA-directed RNA polymerase II subunit RPB4 n=1 Tax=Candida viswanathii TaxID=5486 RepID=A0A367YMP9_9ASCO|nr:DNA-directed RNA polymerase II subunit RPB4 [Candida viswanathii]
MNVSTSALGVRRRKVATQNIDDEENSAVLKLGPEFQLDQITNQGEKQKLIALNVSEARLLIRAALKERKKSSNKKKKNSNGLLSNGRNGGIDAMDEDAHRHAGDGIDTGDVGGNGDDDEEEDDDVDEKEDEISNIELAGPNSNEVVHKTLNYLTNFSRFKNTSSVETVEKLLNDFSEHCNEPLHPFELAQLGTLECEDSEEAKSLIPSLTNKVSDVQLQTLLTELRKYQTLS